MTFSRACQEDAPSLSFDKAIPNLSLSLLPHQIPYSKEDYEANKARHPEFYKDEVDGMLHGNAPRLPEKNIDKMVAELTDRCERAREGQGALEGGREGNLGWEGSILTPPFSTHAHLQGQEATGLQPPPRIPGQQGCRLHQ